MKLANKKILIFCFIAFLIVVKQDSALAVYDVVRAKTLNNENDFSPKPSSDAVSPTYNDADFPEYIKEDTLISKLEKKIRKYFNKKNKQHDENIEEEEIQEELIEDSQKNIPNEGNDNEISEEKQNEDEVQYSDDFEEEENFEQNIPVVKENITQKIADDNKFRINADKITYNDLDGNVYAEGNVEIMPKGKDIYIKANRAVLDRDEQVIKLFENVRVLKQSIEMKGEYLVIDLNEQNILMDNPKLNAYSFEIEAQEGYLIANDVEMLNGTVKSTNKNNIKLYSRAFQRYDRVSNITFDGELEEQDSYEEELLASQKTKTFRIDAKEMVISSFKEHNSVTFKDADIFYKNHKIIRKTDIEVISDKKSQVIDVSAPAFGAIRGFGSFAGYDFVKKMPHGHILKISPVLSYGDNNFGVGLIGRYRSRNHFLEGGWNSSYENLIIRGKYRLTDKFNVTYGRSAYIPENFLGSNRSGYAAQLQYMDNYYIKDLKVRFRHSAYAGVFSDYSKKDLEDQYSTTRFRYMAELNKNVFKYENNEQKFGVRFDIRSQMASTLYGCGNTTGIVRIGPNLYTRFRRWESSVGYFLSGTHGETPFRFDRYRYGKSVVMFTEKFNLTERLAFGFRLFVTPMKDNYKDELFTESRFYFIYGPPDLKLALSYDFVRDIAHVDFMLMLGPKNSIINFEKLTTKNMDGNEEKKDFYKSVKPVKIQRPEDI